MLEARIGWSLALAFLVAVGCAQGNGERLNLDDKAPVEVEDVEREAPPSETELLAQANEPTEEPVANIPEALRCDGSPPGRVLQRLNRQEYNNTVRDLLGDSTKPALAFPEDDHGDSFNNNARALTVSPLLTEGYLDSAKLLALAAPLHSGRQQQRIVACKPSQLGAETCATNSLRPYLVRAFRRPVRDEEVQHYVDLVMKAREEGASFDEAMQLAIEASLLSVHFLFRVELDPDPDESTFHRLTHFELANRLSYFLWSTMPDEQLRDAAAAGQLDTEEGILTQVDRMLASPKADALLTSFAGQWLETNDISRSNEPATDLFPEYTPALKAAMEQETQFLLRDVLSGERPLSDLLLSRETHVNQELAEFYGLQDVVGEEMQEVSLMGTARQGLLGHGSVLTLTAAPTRTSPVRRGVYVLTNLLCSPPPPPPPNVQGDLDTAEDGIPDDLPLAEKAQLHSSKPECANCHSLMDPIGFGLENFDAIGRYREQEQGQTIAASGELTLSQGSVEFKGPEELSQLLSEDPRLVECATKKAYTFALSRLPDTSSEADVCRLDALREGFEAEQDFRSLIRNIVLTDSFRGRHGGLTVGPTEKVEQ